MRVFVSLLSSLILAAWVALFAVLSIQNVDALTLRFLMFRTVELPLGVAMAFAFGIGAIVGTLSPLLLPWRRPVGSER
ncbi:MAG: DUF1049 domain-containing protein [Cyanobacteria bacterium QS_8_64_29]|nr:MAG: DUF1049 domain-containing protein [Cyanobacteria bacterium QS_8_64_29]